MAFTARTSLGNFLSTQWASWAVSRTGVNFPNCFTYATARISEIVGYNQPLDPVNQKVNGAQDLWTTHHPNFTQSSTPKAGALMIWRYGTWGHVAVCENGNGTAWSQSNYGGATFEYITGNPNGYCGMQFLGYLIHKDLNGGNSSSAGCMTFEQMEDEDWAVEFKNDIPITIHKDSTSGASIGTFIKGEKQVYTKKGAYGGHRWIGWKETINGTTYKCIAAISGSETRGQEMWVDLIDPSTINKTTESKPAETKTNYTDGVKYYGADISKHNTNFEICDNKFLIIRASYGTNTDSAFIDNVNKAKSAGIPFGLYCYSYALDNEGAESEADYIIDLMQKNNIIPDLGVWYDMEDADGYKKKNNALTADNCTNFTKIFCDKLKNAGYYTGYYTSSSWVNTYVKNITYPLWIANWGSNDGNLNGNFKNCAVMHQYTSTPYDKNVLYVDFAEMKSNPITNKTDNTETKNEPVQVGTYRLDDESIELLRENVDLLKRLSNIIKM